MIVEITLEGVATTDLAAERTGIESKASACSVFGVLQDRVIKVVGAACSPIDTHGIAHVFTADIKAARRAELVIERGFWKNSGQGEFVADRPLKADPWQNGIGAEGSV